MYKKFIFVYCVAIIAIFHQSEGKNVKRAAESPDGKMNVVMETQEVWGWPNQPTALKCYYWLDSGADLPVRVTWKVGDGPRDSETIAVCSHFTRQRGECEDVQVDNPRLSISMIDMMVALQFDSIQQGDDRSYWCHVQVEDGDSELGFDAASTVMRIYNNAQQSLPKFHVVQAEKSTHETQTGGAVTLSCSCDGYHCDDVAWYKGPVNNNEQQFQLVYTKFQRPSPIPTETQAYDDWIGRASLIENSLKIEDVRASDAGRYWCEVRSSEYYGIGEYATDASSTTLKIIN